MAQANVPVKVTGDPLTAQEVNSLTDSVNSKADSSPNSTNLAIRDRANHTGTQPAATVVEDSTHRFVTDSEKAKLLGVQPNATANESNAALRDRSTHTGVQSSSTISDFTEAVQDAVASLLQGGTNVSLSYNDPANTLTITGVASSGGVTDPETVRDVIGVALIGLGNINVAVNDAADTITITTTATVNDTDANLKNRTNHTGTQAPSTITQDANNRFVTDADKANWNAKQAALTAGSGITIVGNTISSSGGGASVTGSGNANVVPVTTPTVAAIQQKIDAATPGTTVRCDFSECPFGDAEALNIVNKTGLILDLNGAALTALQSRTMIYLNGGLTNFQLTNGRIYNNSPTLPYGSKYGYFATITSNEDAQFDNILINRLDCSTPNADQDFFLFSCYRDVQGNNGGTALLKGVKIKDNTGKNFGRMFCEFINGGSKYGDYTERYIDCVFEGNIIENLGIISSDHYGMLISADGMNRSFRVSKNKVRNAQGNAIEIVNGRDFIIEGNTVIDLDNGAGCVGISITNNAQFENAALGRNSRTNSGVINSNVVDVKGRPIQAYQVERLGLNNNEFTGVRGSDFILKKSRFVGNDFLAKLPQEPVVNFHPSGDNGKFWCSTNNVLNGNTISNSVPGQSKPNGYTGPYQLLQFDGGSNGHSITGNVLIMDSSVDTNSFKYINYANNSDPATSLEVGNIQTKDINPAFA